MKFALTFGLALAALAEVASAHYRFAWLTAGGAKGAEYQYIRKNTNYNSPVDVGSIDNRCNAGGASGSGVATVNVAAGSSVTFTLDTAVYHQGPIIWYLGKAPSKAADWDGSGTNWFKIAQVGPTFSGGTSSWPMSLSYTTTIPSKVPSGEYLLRIEQIGLHNPGSTPQFYVSCAQINVTGGGNGNPTPKFTIPGHISATDPGITVNIYNAFTSYKFPGSAVATY
ncbi:glycoside hydrolase family 61 protein-like protein [Peziza echinospora]|nr:glycoside hydrolase family 61 protein-like protein [Peziza echinospora]